MTSPKTRILAAVAAGVAGAFGVANPAGAAEPSTQDLLNQIDALKSKVEQLQSTQQRQQEQLEGVRYGKSDVDATVASVLADAERRSQLLQDDAAAMTGGYQDGKFFLRSGDGNFYLQPTLHLQVRHVTNYREEEGVGGDSDTQNGFEIRRARFGFRGHLFSPDLQYNFLWETAREGGGVAIQDAFVTWQFADDWALRGGQFKDPVFHEENMSPLRQLAAERSLLNELIGGGQTDRIQGVGVIYEGVDRLTVTGIFHDGYNSDNTNFTEAGGTAAIGIAPTNWGVAGRAEYLAMGTEKQYDDFTARGNEDDLLAFGVGGDWSQGGDGNVFFHTVDAQYETSVGGKGLGLYGALVGTYRDSAELVLGQDSAYDWGFLVQAGYMTTEDCEVFARWDMTRLDEDLLATGGEDTYHEFTIGTNYYMYGHNAKVTIDLSFLPNGSPVNVTGAGVLAGEDDQFVLRGQFQLFL